MKRLFASKNWRYACYLAMAYLVVGIAILAMSRPERADAAVIVSQPIVNATSSNGAVRYVNAWIPDRNYSVRSISIAAYGTFPANADKTIYHDNGACGGATACDAVISGDFPLPTWDTITLDDPGAGVYYFTIGSTTPYIFLAGQTYYLPYGYAQNAGVSRGGSIADTMTGLQALSTSINVPSGTAADGVYADLAFSMCDTYGPCAFDFVDTATTTHISTVTPAASSTIATSTSATIAATGYINANDFSEGMFIQFSFAPFAASQSFAAASPDLLFTKLYLPVSSSGHFSVSTTTSLLVAGEYGMITSIYEDSIANNLLNFFGFGQFATFGLRYSTTTTFIVSTSTAFDLFMHETQDSLNNYLASSTISLAACTEWTSFTLRDCLNLLLVPQPAPIRAALDNFKNQFLSYAPWGYLTRFITILSGNATPTDLPSFVVTIPINNADDLTSLSFNMQDTITGGAALLGGITARDSSLTLRDIAEPLIKLFVALQLIIIIVHDLTRIPATAHNFNNRRKR